MTWWHGLLLLYVGVCVGWGAKEGWDQDGFGEAVGNGFLYLVGSVLVPFVLVGYLWKRRGRRRAERDQFYSPFGGYDGYKRWRKANPGVSAAIAASQMREEGEESDFEDEP